MQSTDITICDGVNGAPLSGAIFDAKTFTNPAGELNVQVEGCALRDMEGPITVTARMRTTDSLVQLMLVREILERARASRQTKLNLVIPYFPYAHQDRVMADNEAFSLKVVARLINSMAFDRVVICDPHSDVTPALVDRVVVIGQLQILQQFSWTVNAMDVDNIVLVSPDAGAAKKIRPIAKFFGRPVLQFDKIRDTATGEITGIRPLDDFSPYKGMDALIVDDICVGGKTFTLLAAILKQEGIHRRFFYCTHGVFSQGLKPFIGHIDWVLTTDSYTDPGRTGIRGVPLFVHRLNFKGALA